MAELEQGINIKAQQNIDESDSLESLRLAATWSTLEGFNSKDDISKEGMQKQEEARLAKFDPESRPEERKFYDEAFKEFDKLAREAQGKPLSLEKIQQRGTENREEGLITLIKDLETNKAGFGAAKQAQFVKLIGSGIDNATVADLNLKLGENSRYELTSTREGVAPTYRLIDKQDRENPVLTYTPNWNRR